MTHDYQPPLSQLLSLGEPGFGADWLNYPSLGLGLDQVDELVRMMQDETLNETDSESDEVWAPLHAWRALGQLRAESAIPGLIGMLYRLDENSDDWLDSDLPKVFGLIGPAAIPALQTVLNDQAINLYVGGCAAGCLTEIATRHPEARDEAVRILSERLESYAENDVTFNGFLIAELANLKAAESTELVERAYAAEQVDESIIGDWQDFQQWAGLIPAEPSVDFRLPPAPPFREKKPAFSLISAEDFAKAAKAQQRNAQKEKARRKQEKKSRKQNRKRK